MYSSFANAISIGAVASAALAGCNNFASQETQDAGPRESVECVPDGTPSNPSYMCYSFFEQLACRPDKAKDNQGGLLCRTVNPDGTTGADFQAGPEKVILVPSAKILTGFNLYRPAANDSTGRVKYIGTAEEFRQLHLYQQPLPASSASEDAAPAEKRIGQRALKEDDAETREINSSGLDAFIKKNMAHDGVFRFYVFTGDYCPHCTRLKKVMDGLVPKRDDMSVTWMNAEFVNMPKDARGIPNSFVQYSDCEKRVHLVGYMGASELEAALASLKLACGG